ncbi:MAG: methyltransferase domain-containing protein [Candidatus Aminicenantes bacterium]|nr:methyltransferase domain-containing protein [Candidatus Aminicenantes bacterium]
MAADIKQLLNNLLGFYDFTGKTIVSIGAGGGQMIEYARPAKRVFAVDSSAAALDTLRLNLGKSDLAGKFAIVLSDFYRCQQTGDVMLFEFCLHELPDPAEAIAHARRLAGDVLVADHFPGSEWAYYVAEEDKVARSWKALHACRPRKVQKHESVQSFKDYRELRQKVESMGEVAISRIEPFIGRTGFTIPMAYGFALL